MKPPPLSNALAMLSSSNSIAPPRLTRDEDGFERMLPLPEKIRRNNWEFVDGDFLSSIRNAVMSAKRVLRRRTRYVKLLQASDLEEAESEVLMDFFQNQNDIDFTNVEKVLINLAIQKLTKITTYYGYHTIQSVQNDDAQRTIIDFGTTVLPIQELSIDAKACLAMISELPSRYEPLFRKIADGCHLSEAANELGLGLIDAMGIMKKGREIMERLRDDSLNSGIIRRSIKFQGNRSQSKKEKTFIQTNNRKNSIHVRCKKSKNDRYLRFQTMVYDEKRNRANQKKMMLSQLIKEEKEIYDEKRNRAHQKKMMMIQLAKEEEDYRRKAKIRLGG